MAQVNNPRKHFQFQVFITGLNPFLAQEVKLPDVDYDVVEHGDTNFDVKTAGKKKIGMLTVSKICPADRPDTFIWAWFNRIGDTRTGGGLLPDEYKETVIVEQYAPDGFSVVQRWEMDGCWPQKLNGIDFSRKSSENTLESIEFCIDEMNSD